MGSLVNVDSALTNLQVQSDPDRNMCLSFELCYLHFCTDQGTSGLTCCLDALRQLDDSHDHNQDNALPRVCANYYYDY